jgi:two-component system, cell cycle sensor histidine kinase and response regulator CckA
MVENENAPATLLTRAGPTPTVLFVDDEPHLRVLGKAVLELHGYAVLLAEDGLEAVEVFRREQQRIDLIVLDLSMPRLSGDDTFHAIRAMNDRVPVLFASGYSHDALSERENPQIAGFVAKPYRPGDLAAAVRETLERRPRTTPGASG